MARASDKAVASNAKTRAASASKAGSKRAAGPAASDAAQRRKDPTFMRNLEAAIRMERARVDAVAGSGAAATPHADTSTIAPASGKSAKGTQRAKLKATAGKATAGKARTGKTPAAKPHRAETKALADELSGLIPELDAEGLAFLIEQARVHLYNMRVAELEDAAVEAERASSRAGSIASAGGAARTGSGDEFAIHASENGSSYDLVWHDKWKMFTDDEMLAMVRITSSRDAVSDVAGRLYRWLLAERRDVIADIPLSGLADPRLRKLVTLLRKTFTVKGKK